jgi:hypothetical protein
MVLSRVEVTIRRGMDWMIGFIHTLYTPLGNYSATADLHILQFIAANNSVLSLLQSLTIRFLATNALNNSDASIPQLNSSVTRLISWQAGVLKLN